MHPFFKQLEASGWLPQGPNMQTLLKDRSVAYKKAEAIVQAAENAGRELTESEEQDYGTAMTAYKALSAQIAQKERETAQRITNQGAVLIEGGRQFKVPAKKTLSPGYGADFYAWVASRGSKVGEFMSEGADGQGGYVLPGFQAASYEGGSTTGAAAVPLTVDQQIIELAPAEVGVRKLAMVLPTIMDIRLPRKTGFGTVGLKAESGATSNLFQDSDATEDYFTLSAFMIGGSHKVSFELAQDVPSFNAFCVRDLLLAHAMYEDGLFVSGSGTGQPQGLIGNVGAGVSGVLAGTDNYGSELLDATYDVMATLNAMYWPGAAWLMQRATGLAIRKAQRKANLFDPIWTREGGVDRLHGFPVEYSANMPAISAGLTPVLFGDFNAGYVVGDRGGSGVNVKILDQPLATAGQIILLAYRRVDGRVRRSEAIQPIVLHS